MRFYSYNAVNEAYENPKKYMLRVMLPIKTENEQLLSVRIVRLQMNVAMRNSYYKDISASAQLYPSAYATDCIGA